MAIRFHPQVAVSAETGELAQGGESGLVVYPGTGTPVPITEDAEGELPIPGSELVVSSVGMVPGFWVQGDTLEVEWLAADLQTRVPMFSPVGLMEAAQAPTAAVYAAHANPDGSWPERPVSSPHTIVLWIGGTGSPTGALPGDLHISEEADSDEDEELA